MVQKQAAVSGGFRADQFAEDDPLAELARIVGFEQPRAGHRPEAEPQAPAANPVFNLEDELLREFETFEAPVLRAEPVAASRPVPQAPVVAPAPVAPVEPRFEQPAVEPAPAFDAAFDWADELAEAEFAAAAIPAVSAPVVERPVAAPVFDEPRVARIEPAPAFEPEPSTDLADELELAFGSAPERVAAEPTWTAPAPVAAPAVVAAAPAVSAAPARISIPLANFQANPAARLEPGFQARPRSEAAPAASTTKPEPRVTLEEPLSDDDWLSSLDVTPAPAKKAAHVEPDLSALDNFAAFSFTSDEAFRQKVAPKAEPVVVAAAEPDFDFSFADELAANDELVAAEPPKPQAVSAPVIRQQPVAEPVAAPVRAQFAEPVFAEPVRTAPKAEAAKPATEDLLGDGEFELMLDDLDLDLSDMDFSEPAPAQVQNRPAPSFATASAAPAPIATRPATVATPVVAAAAAPSASFVAPATVSANPFARGNARDLDAPLPFDPEEIIEQEDQPESVSMVDVPDVVFAEEVQAPARRADFEYDLDTELAGLFENHAPAPAAPVMDFTPAAAAPKQAAPLDDFDAFERALEEDFRRTLQSPAEAKPRPAGQISLDAMELEKDRPRLPKSWLLAAGVAGAVLVIGGGAWALLGGGSSTSVASGEPVVIMADKDPVKVLPENPGGKTVPNQDKAVYDTVSGAGAAAPTQQSLISSNEEPVDVVQRTLMPDNLPMEDDGEEAASMGTPVGETEDPRLLPGDRVTADAGNPGDDSAIAPRKVRTMIVKPDGTLVAQEVPATAPMGNVQTLAANQPSALAPVTPSASVPVEPVATPVATAPVGETPSETEAVAVAAPGMPVPVARPSAQPANVVARVSDQGNVSAPTPAEAAASTSVAAAPAQQPAAPQQPAATQQASVPPGSYVIQIASLPSEADAQTSYRNLSNKFGSVIGGRGVDIKSADIPGKGTYYRVRIPAGTKAEAEQLCSRYKSAGGSCLVVR